MRPVKIAVVATSPITAGHAMKETPPAIAGTDLIAAMTSVKTPEINAPLIAPENNPRPKALTLDARDDEWFSISSF